MLCLSLPKFYKLSGDKYELIKERVVDLFEDFGISSIPIYPGRILQKMGFEVVSYDVFSVEEMEIACKYSHDAFRFDAGFDKPRFVLYSPDKTKERIRFSLAHELGHIVLEHEYKEDPYQEAEADFFAGYLLAPVPLVPNLCEKLSPESVSRKFVISLDCANNAVRRCITRKTCKVKVTEYESRILDTFGFEIDFFQNWITHS